MVTIVILHGWGLTGSKYSAVEELFKKKRYDVMAPDFPGFGATKLDKKSMHMDDYVQFLKKYLQGKNSVVLLGHSFGGRVAAKFSARYPEQVKALILTGAPLIKKPLPAHKQIVQFLAKTAKKAVPTFLEEIVRKNTYRLLGEWDYYKAGELKQTLRNILAEDISPQLAHIKAPTLVLWGEKDTFVSVAIGREIAGRIQGAQLEVIHEGTHKLPYENPTLFAERVISFLDKVL